MFSVTAPYAATPVPQAVGRVSYVTAPSTQLLSFTSETAPPAGLPALFTFAACSRSLALCTGPESADRSKRSSNSRTGDPSTITWFDAP